MGVKNSKGREMSQTVEKIKNLLTPTQPGESKGKEFEDVQIQKPTPSRGGFKW